VIGPAMSAHFEVMIDKVGEIKSNVNNEEGNKDKCVKSG